jgi:glutathione peroxidase
MTLRQTVLKLFYPLLRRVKFIDSSKKVVLHNSAKILPQDSFYNLTATANNGNIIHFKEFEGKKLLLVNTASDCGYTAQYDELEKLYEQYQNNLVVVGFPANDFKNQEKGTDEQIAQFCKINYGVTFPLVKKSSVVKGINQNEVFEWLSNKNKNGWNSEQPSWNFAKYLVNERGMLINYFGPAVSPLDETIIKAINE